MKIEHGTNAGKYWACNRIELLKKWDEKPNKQKAMQKRTENTASGRITARECNPTYIFTAIKFTNIFSKQMLSNNWLKYQIQIAENFQILNAKFDVVFKNIYGKVATKFLSTLVLSRALENYIYAKSTQKYFNFLQPNSVGCSLANLDTKDPIVIQILLIARSALSSGH